MNSALEQHEREQRAKRLEQARRRAGYLGPKAVADKFHWNMNTYKAHESGRNGFGLVAAKEYAKAFGVSVNWLNNNTGSIDDAYEDPSQIYVQAPLISWVAAGALAQPDFEPEIEDAPIILEPGLDPSGDWIALRVNGDSMNRVSPHDSIIFVNRKDRRLIPHGLYIIGDGNGGATFKRYRPPNTWEPVSTNPEHEPFVLPDGQEPDIIGRVRKSSTYY